MKTTATRLLLVLALTGFPIQGFAQSFIVKNGKPRAEIVIAEKPARAAKFGATRMLATKIVSRLIFFFSVPSVALWSKADNAQPDRSADAASKC